MALPKNPDFCFAIKNMFHAPKLRTTSAKSLAEDIGMRDEFALYELANPESTRHLHAEEIVALFKASGRDPRLIEAVCEKCGGAFVDLEPYREGRGVADLAAVMEVAAVFVKECAAALAAGEDLTAKRKQDLDRRASVALNAIVAFTARKVI